MYCNDCGKFFKTPLVRYEDPSPGGVGLPAGFYAFAECPFCGSDDITESGTCKHCGNPTTDILCDECLDEVIDSLKWLKDKVDDYELQEIFGKVVEKW